MELPLIAGATCLEHVCREIQPIILKPRLQPLVVLLSSEDDVPNVVCGSSFTGLGDGRAGCEIGTAEERAGGEDV
jgi:hypothetical protein